MRVRRSRHLGLAAPTALLLAAVGCAGGELAGGSDGPRTYTTLQEMADVLGCADPDADYEDTPPPSGPASYHEGFCTADGVLVRLWIFSEADFVDVTVDTFSDQCEIFVSLGGDDIHYATGDRWLLTPGEPEEDHNRSTIAGMARQLGGETHTLECA
jgi:hypothetical protein